MFSQGLARKDNTVVIKLAVFVTWRLLQDVNHSDLIPVRPLETVRAKTRVVAREVWLQLD